MQFFPPASQTMGSVQNGGAASGGTDARPSVSVEIGQDSHGRTADGSMDASRVNQSMEGFQDGDANAPPGLQSTEIVPYHNGRGERGNGGTDPETRGKRMDACEEIYNMLLNWRDKIQYSMQFRGVALTVLVSVTLSGFVNPPGGVTDANGIFRSSNHFQITLFVICDSLSFFLALGALILIFTTTVPSPAEYKPTRENVGRKALATQRSLIKRLSRSIKGMGAILYMVNLCFVLSLCLCAFAFIASGILMTDKQHGRNAFLVISSLGPGFIGAVMSLHIGILKEIWPPPHFDLKNLDSILEPEQNGPPGSQ